MQTKREEIGKNEGWNEWKGMNESDGLSSKDV